MWSCETSFAASSSSYLVIEGGKRQTYRHTHNHIIDLIAVLTVNKQTNTKLVWKMKVILSHWKQLWLDIPLPPSEQIIYS